MWLDVWEGAVCNFTPPHWIDTDFGVFAGRAIFFFCLFRFYLFDFENDSLFSTWSERLSHLVAGGNLVALPRLK